MSKNRVTAALLLATTMSFTGMCQAADRALTLLVLADTVPPLMITSPGNPMAGGIVTDVVRQVFKDAPYEVRPLVVPWQRMTVEMEARNDWISYSHRSECLPGSGCVRSADRVVDFEHVVVTLADSPLSVLSRADLIGRNLLLVENFHYPGLDPHLTNPVDSEGSGEILDVRAFTPEAALRMLRHRRGDAYIDWRLRVLYNLPSAGLTRDDVRLMSAAEIVPTQGIHLIFSEKLPTDVQAHVDARLGQFRRDGTISEIVERYR